MLSPFYLETPTLFTFVCTVRGIFIFGGDLIWGLTVHSEIPSTIMDATRSPINIHDYILKSYTEAKALSDSNLEVVFDEEHVVSCEIHSTVINLLFILTPEGRKFYFSDGII